MIDQPGDDRSVETVERAAATLRNIRSVWVKEPQAIVENNRVTAFEANVKISFVVEDGADVGAAAIHKIS